MSSACQPNESKISVALLANTYRGHILHIVRQVDNIGVQQSILTIPPTPSRRVHRCVDGEFVADNFERILGSIRMCVCASATSMSNLSASSDRRTHSMLST
jgi:hypothetical protein